MALSEMMIVTAVMGITGTVLAQSLVMLTRSSADATDRIQLHMECRRVQEGILNELASSSTRVTHQLPDDLVLPLDAEADPKTVSEAYNFPAIPIGVLHQTQRRDDNEYFHDESEQRRFYIYASYEPFDTLEFQRAVWPRGERSAFSNGEMQLVWSNPRKIYLERGRVVLKTRTDDGAVRQGVLGVGVTSLSFHVDAGGSLFVTVSMRSTKRDFTVTSTGQIRPWNDPQ